ncbi:MAG: FMN-binding glutamate synthase family protein, partial [Actinomycetes bacterium]
DPDLGAERVANYLRAITAEAALLAAACGHASVHDLRRDDLVALTVEAAAMARVPLAGTTWIPGLPSGPGGG